MALNVNRVTLAGNIVRDPETRDAGEGSVTNFTIAVNRPKSDEADFVDIAAWNNIGKAVADYKKKGDPVFVEGALRIRSYEDNDGNRKYRTQIQATNVQFLPSKRDESGSSNDSSDNENFDDIPF